MKPFKNSRWFPCIFFFGIWLIFSYQFFLKGRIPAPLDLLVNFFAPWDKYYDSPVKNPAITDVVNQIIPWKTLTVWSLRHGTIPLWNPYNLAGAPHLANWQSGVLYPTNLLFLVLPFVTAWSLHILLQPLLAGLFMIFFLRSLSLSPISSFMGALAFSYGGFMTAWLEWGTLGHALLWLPLALYGVEKLATSDKRLGKTGKFLIVFSWVMSLFAGHLQISLYVIATTVAYFIFRTWSVLYFRSLLTTIYLLLATFFISTPQILPSFQLYQHAYRSASLDPEWFKAFRIPFYGLLTFLAPDFFGNPVTRNHWSDHSYIEMMGYVGIIPFFLSLIAIFRLKRSDLPMPEGRTLRNVRKFFIGIILVSLAFSLKTPLADMLLWLKIPVLSSSSPARVVGLIAFSLSVLASVGMDEFVKLVKKKMWKSLHFSLALLSISFLVLWLWVLLSGHPMAPVARRNLIFPTGLLIGTIGGIWGIGKVGKMTIGILLLTTCYLLLATFDLFRFHQKFTSFTDKKLFYPEIPAITFLKNHPGRTFGMFDANLNLPFRVRTIEGYDPLVIGDYVMLTSRAETGKAVLPKRTSGIQLPKNGKKTMEILSEFGVRYVVQPTVHGAAPWELHLWEYPTQLKRVYADSEYEVYENLFATPDTIEPYSWMKRIQTHLFLTGLVVSGGTLCSLLFFSIQRRKK